MTPQEITTKTEEILKDVPAELKGPISYMAYERGHSAGEEEVLNILQGIVADLLPAITEYGRRCKEESWDKAKEFYMVK